ncbi:protein sip-5 [Luteimonas soli]|uniref:Protein sip-5 n=1 Tax=Luteimonas soli TaxID=1648966 RepID=A0ABV7XLA0_9GAMM
MKFEAIRRRVERSEQLVDGRALQTGVRAAALKTTWRESWTPARIILAGLAAGFLAGRADPTRALKQLGSGGRWVQLVGALSGLAASLQSSIAAAGADEAVDRADDAANQAGEAAAAAQTAVDGATSAPAATDAPEPLPRSDRRRPDPTWNTPPGAAEAATEISEQR